LPSDDDGFELSSRPVEGHAWQAGTTPWLRAMQSASLGEPAIGYAICPFCGASTLKLSVSDLYVDPGRLTVYCDNMNCDARETEVIVMRDGGNSGRRADVRAIRAIDAGKAEQDPEPRQPALRFVSITGPPEPEMDRVERRNASLPQALKF